MATCVKLVRKKTQVCIGSLNKKIDIFTRVLTSPLDPTNSDVDYDETFTLLANVWSMIATPKGQTIFDAIGTEKTISDLFYIRHIAELTAENWIVFNSNRYDIILVRDYEQNNLFQELSCIFRGDDTKGASKS